MKGFERMGVDCWFFCLGLAIQRGRFLGKVGWIVGLEIPPAVGLLRPATTASS